MLALYRAVSAAASPLIESLLQRRLAAGKEDRARFRERFGESIKPRPEGPLVWVHGASVGESLSALSLVTRLLDQNPGSHVLVTTGTVTSAALMSERLPARAFHQYAPIDRIDCVRNFLGHWRPDLALWIESEFWPNLLIETHRRGAKLVLINARISPRAFSRWRWLRPFIRPMLKAFDLCLAQNEAEAARLRSLGAPLVRAPGNLKFAAAPLPVRGEEMERLRAAMGGRARWLAASTHPGEDEMAGDVHIELASRFPGLLTVIVPRHPARGAAIAAMLRGRGLAVARRGAGEAIAANTNVYVADSMGELGLFFRLCPIAFIGGSLVPHGGHNPIEPAQLGCAVIYGPHMTNFREIAEDLERAEAAIEVEDAAGLSETLAYLLADGTQVKRLAVAARAVAESKAQVLDRVMAELAPFLAALTKKEPHLARA
jgi:3-deoxy-D-manno-octulosonic-acid transferase